MVARSRARTFLAPPSAGSALMRVARALLFGLLVASVPSPARAKLEHEVKAAYLFKFLSYVEWPLSALGDERAPIVIGVLGAEEVRAALQEVVSHREAQGHRIEVREVTPEESPTATHVLFVGNSAATELPKVAGRPGVLLVTEFEGALEEGAMINLVRVGDRIRFEVAPETARRKGLHISSRVLALAHFVKSGD